jgi:hypothetical protein
LRDGPRRFTRDSTCPALLRNLSNEPSHFRLRDFHPLWSAFPSRSTSLMVGNSSALRPDRPYNPLVQAREFGLFRVRSPLLAESLSCFLFLWVLRWFTSPRSPPPTYGFSRGSLGMTQGGLPHSEIAGSKPVCGSPTLIAADHVLHRLLAPRHSPYALSSLTINQPGCDSLSDRSSPSLQKKRCSSIARRIRNSHALRVVVGKNYRLQDIQLSKSSAALTVPRYQPRKAACGFPPNKHWWRIPGSNR